MVYVYIPLFHLIWHCRQYISPNMFHILPCSVPPALALCLLRIVTVFQQRPPCCIPYRPCHGPNQPPSPQILFRLLILRVSAYSCLIQVRFHFFFLNIHLEEFSERWFTGLCFLLFRFYVFCNQLWVIARARAAEEWSYKSSTNPVLLIDICLKWVITLPLGHYGMKPGIELLNIARNQLANL